MGTEIAVLVQEYENFLQLTGNLEQIQASVKGNWN
jgi:hypothetical protein